MDKRTLDFENTIVRLSRFKRAWHLEILRKAMRSIAETGYIDERSTKILNELEKEQKLSEKK